MLLTILCSTVLGGCPFAGKVEEIEGHNSRITKRVAPKGYFEAFEALDFDAVRDDIKTMLTESQDFWPADYGNYGPLLVRLSWHSAGSYRVSDGRGGVDGARQRFDPERSWGDNINLHHARRLLQPIKLKYGLGLSWGDLIVLAGEEAIKAMGGPILGFCGGRIDDVDGFWSERLGPNADQEQNEPCVDPGLCDNPFGANLVGLIYVNPEGPKGVPEPSLSAPQVRSTFARMGMNDEETVALVGGGHAFGKTHGACDTPTGPGPDVAPLNPWAGNCGTGVGVDSFGSGFEGPWTTTPIAWSNEYFSNLIDYPWEAHRGSGGHIQWRVPLDAPFRPTAPFADNTGQQDLMMLTADIALWNDTNYRPLVRRFADNQADLDDVFARAWYKLTTRDMGPVSRCLGDELPAEVQPFQGPLPAPPAKLADFDAVRTKIEKILDQKYGNGPMLIQLAWRCAATFRVTDYQGGCNGARIRLSPQKDWEVNDGLDEALELLEPVMAEFDEGLSWADLIVLAGTVSLEAAGAPAMAFCGGRTDAPANVEDVISPNLEYTNMEAIVSGNLAATEDDLEQYTLLLGLNAEEFTALMSARALARTVTNGIGCEYYHELITNTWTPYEDVFKAVGGYDLRRADDILLISHPEYLEHVQRFAGDEDAYLAALANAWTKMMNADRFDGPTGNLCDAKDDSSAATGGMEDTEKGNNSTTTASGSKTLEMVVIAVLAGALALALGALVLSVATRKAARTVATEMPTGPTMRREAQWQMEQTTDTKNMATLA